MSKPDEYKNHEERGAGVDPIPDPDFNKNHSAENLLEEAVSESVDKVKDDFSKDSKKDSSTKDSSHQ